MFFENINQILASGALTCEMVEAFITEKLMSQFHEELCDNAEEDRNVDTARNNLLHLFLLLSNTHKHAGSHTHT